MKRDFPLTAGQLAGYDLFAKFYLDPLENVMLLKGYSGTGKSTLVSHMLEQLPKLNSLMKMVDPGFVPWDFQLTATTNKAAEALMINSGCADVRTIHSYLGLRVQTNYQTGKTFIQPIPGKDPVSRTLIFIDEASFVDQTLLKFIFERTEDCKLVFIGDPAQLTPVGATYMPAFNMSKNQIELTEPVRQDDSSPLKPLIEALRQTVLGGPWPKFELYPGVIEKVDQKTFQDRLFLAFANEKNTSIKALAYTNKTVIAYNELLSRQVKGTSEPAEGDYMVVNKAVNNKASKCNTEEEVLITSIAEDTEYEVEGWTVRLSGKGGSYFMPRSRDLAKIRLKQAQAGEEWHAMEIITDTWIDLRPAFACTVNKSQGSTYDIGFIDLNDMGKIRTGNQLARALYVGISRFRRQVTFTGDIA
jgi:hypothetical protein